VPILAISYRAAPSAVCQVIVKPQDGRKDLDFRLFCPKDYTHPLDRDSNNEKFCSILEMIDGISFTLRRDNCPRASIRLDAL